MTELRRILVVGGSLAGLRAAEGLRREGYEGELSILSGERQMPYDRPPLSKEVLTGEMEADAVRLVVAEDLGAEWILDDPAVELDLGRRVVRSRGGRDLRFDGLVIATGSTPRRLRPLDVARPGICELRTLDDALELRQALAARPRVVIVGCGFIGVEVASAARALGSEVSIVSIDPPLIVGGALVSGVCAQMLADSGARLALGRQVVAVEGEPGVEAVVLDDGTRLEADLVVVAVGARPVTDWLEGSGLVVEDGVVCDACCAALGAERIVAAGDVSRWPNLLFDATPMRIEHWTNAVEQGMAAARTLLRGSDAQTAYAPVPSFWSDHLGTRLQTVGVPRLADRSVVVEGSLAERRFVAAAYHGDQLVAAVTYGMARALVPYRIKLADGRVPASGATA